MEAHGIVVDPAIHFGKPCVKGTRIPVHAVLELVEAGISFDKIVKDHYPDLTIEDVEEVLANPTHESTSASTGRPCVWGYTLEGVYIIVVYEAVDAGTIRAGRETVIVSYKDQRRTFFLVQFPKQFENVLPVSAVEIPRRLIRKQNRGLHHEGASKRYTLLLAA